LRNHLACTALEADLAMDVARLENIRVPIKGGGVCIYCGWDGGSDGLRDEHIVPYSLGGTVQLKAASCSRCERITSYIDGYLANGLFGNFRVHTNLQSRSGHPTTLTATVELENEVKVVDLATKDHPYFLNMPVWRPPGVLVGAQISEGFVNADAHKYWYLPSNIRDSLGMSEGEIGKVIDTSRPPNYATFCRGLAKIAYCDAVLRFGLNGFRPLAIVDIILGKYQNIAHFVGSEGRKRPLPPSDPGIVHFVSGGTATYQRLKLLVSEIRLFADSGTAQEGMPIYTVVVGAQGSRKILPRQPLSPLPRTICL
jgi:hypothetical protein